VASGVPLTVELFENGGERLPLGQRDTDGEPEGLADAPTERELRGLPVPPRVALPSEVALRESRGDDEGEALAVPLTEKDAEVVGENEPTSPPGVTVRVPDTEPDIVRREVGVTVEDEEALRDKTPEELTVGANVSVGTGVALAEAHAEAEGESEARALAVLVTRAEKESKPCERLTEGVANTEMVSLAGGEGVVEGDTRLLGVPQGDGSPVVDAVEDTVAVGEPVSLRREVADTVEDAVIKGVAEPLPSAEGVPVVEPEAVGRTVTVGVGESDTGEVSVGCGESVAAAVDVGGAVVVTVPAAVLVEVRELAGVPLSGPVVEPDAEGEREAEGQTEGAAVPDGEPLPVAEGEGSGELVVEALPEGGTERERVGTPERVADAVMEPVTVDVSARDAVGALVWDSFNVGDKAGVRVGGGERDAELSGEPVMEAEVQPESVPGCSVLVPCSVTEEEVVPEGASEGKVLPVALAEGDGVGEREGPPTQPVAEGEPVPGAEGDVDTLGEPVGVFPPAPGVAVLGAAEGDVEKDVVALREPVPSAVEVAAGEGDALPHAVEEAVGAPEPDRSALHVGVAVVDALSVCAGEDVEEGLVVSENEPVTLAEGVPVAQEDEDAEGGPVTVPVGGDEAVASAVLLPGALPVASAVAEGVEDVEGDAENVFTALEVGAAGVRVGSRVARTDGDTPPEPDRESLAVTEGERLTRGEEDKEGVLRGEAEWEGERGGVGVTEALPRTEGDAEGDKEGVVEGAGESEIVTGGVAVARALADNGGLLEAGALGVPEGQRDREAVPLPESGGVALPAPALVAEGASERDTDADAEEEAEAVEVPPAHVGVLHTVGV
jgi:hypothetical protein